MYCARCGAPNDEGMRFCTKCGCPLEEDGSARSEGTQFANERTVVVTRASSAPVVASPSGGQGSNTANNRERRVPAVAIAVLACAVIAVLACVAIDPWGSIWHQGESGGDVSNSDAGVIGGSSSISGSVDKGESGYLSSEDSAPSDSADNAGNAHSHQGTSSVVGNLVNGGHFAAGDDGYLYYAAPVDGTDWDTRSIVRCRPDGSQKSTIYSAPKDTMNLYHLSVIDTYVVFNQVIDKNSTVVCVRTDGTGQTTLDSCDDWSLCQVDDGWVYYLKSGRICRCDMEGGNRSTLASVGTGTYWRIAGTTLVTFSEKGAHEIFASELDGSKRRIAYASPDGYEVKNAFPLDSSTLQVWEAPTSGEGTRLSRVGLATTDAQVFWNSSKGIERMCAYEDGAIVTRIDSGDSYRILSVSYDTGKVGMEVSVASGQQARYTAYLLNRIYFGAVGTTSDPRCSICSLSLSGGTPSTIT